MFSLLLLELLSVASLLYSLLLIFLSFAPAGVMALIFLWTVAVCLFYRLSRGWAKIFRASLLLLAAPLFFYHGSVALIFILITALLLLVYLERFMERGSSREYAGSFKVALLLFVAAIYLRWVGPGVWEAIALAAPFIFIYVLSTVMLIRSVRHVEAGMDLRRLQGTNLRYLLALALFFLLAAMGGKDLFIRVGRSLLSILFLPLQLLFRLIDGFSTATFNPGGDRLPEFPEQPPEQVGEEVPPGEAVGPGAMTGGPLEKILIFLLVAAVIYVLYKLIARGGKHSYRGQDYVEEREYIKGKKKAPRPRPAGLRARRGQPLEQVRYFYRKFLEKLAARQVELSGTDTSQDIEAKALAVFPQGTQEIRQIYLPSRYGQIEGDSDLAARMEKLYREL